MQMEQYHGHSMQEIVLKLTLGEVNAVLFALSEKPYKDVADLIDKIRCQGNEQIKEEREG